MSRGWARSVLVLASLLAWLTPAAASLGVLAHLALDSHHHRGEDLEQAAVAATHGHSHDTRAAEHEHSAVRERTVDHGAPLVAALGRDASRDVDLVSRADSRAHSQPTESPPLFLSSRALRL